MLVFHKLHAKLNLLCECENQEDVESHVLGIAEPQEQPNINCQAQGSESHPLIIHNLHVFLAFSSSEERTDNIWQLLGNMNFVTSDKKVYLFATSQSLQHICQSLNSIPDLMHQGLRVFCKASVESDEMVRSLLALLRGDSLTNHPSDFSCWIAAYCCLKRLPVSHFFLVAAC